MASTVGVAHEKVINDRRALPLAHCKRFSVCIIMPVEEAVERSQVFASVGSLHEYGAWSELFEGKASQRRRLAALDVDREQLKAVLADAVRAKTFIE